VTGLVIFGAAMARLARHYFSSDSPYRVAASFGIRHSAFNIRIRHSAFGIQH